MEGMEATFILKDVIYIVVGVSSALGKKFSGMHTRMEKSEEKNKTELDTINKELSEVKIGISTINGKLDILINNNV
jgi:hypothetical protein